MTLGRIAERERHSLKSEWVHYRVFHTRYEASTNLFFFIEAFYNRRRRNSALEYVSPVTYEHLYYQQYQSCLTPCPLN